jgi:hypothetical protein
MKKLIVLLLLFTSCITSKKIHKKYPIIHRISKNKLIIKDSLTIYELRLGL